MSIASYKHFLKQSERPATHFVAIALPSFCLDVYMWCISALARICGLKDTVNYLTGPIALHA